MEPTHAISAKYVRLRREGRAAWITLDRPPLNVMNIAMMEEIRAAFEECAGKSEFLIFEGAGEKGFSAGAEVGDHAPDRVGKMLAAFHRIFRALWRGDFITIAAVRGHCLGGGCELAAFCDFVLAEESAKFGQPEITLGCFPPVAMILLPRLIGMRAAMDLILTGRGISAAEARELGLVTRVVADGSLRADVAALIADLAQLSAPVLRMSRKMLLRSSGFDFGSALDEVEEFYLSDLMKTPDAQEGIRAFLEKRAPVWQGR